MRYGSAKTGEVVGGVGVGIRDGGFEVSGVGGRMSTADSAGDGMLKDGAADMGMGDTTEPDVDGRTGDKVDEAAADVGPTMSTSMAPC